MRCATKSSLPTHNRVDTEGPAGAPTYLTFGVGNLIGSRRVRLTGSNMDFRSSEEQGTGSTGDEIEQSYVFMFGYLEEIPPSSLGRYHPTPLCSQDIYLGAIQPTLYMYKQVLLFFMEPFNH
jgi:hypothetical protein